MEFAEAIVTNPVIIRLKREEESLDNIKQYYVECKNQDAKYAAIANIYGVATIGQAMIFCHVSLLCFVESIFYIKFWFCQSIKEKQSTQTERVQSGDLKLGYTPAKYR